MIFILLCIRVIAKIVNNPYTLIINIPLGGIMITLKELSTMDGHHHSHKHRKQVVNRLARIEGHIGSIKNMVNSGRDCADVLLQIAAVQKALYSAAKVILKEHLETCVIDAAKNGDQDKILQDLNKALDHYIR